MTGWVVIVACVGACAAPNAGSTEHASFRPEPVVVAPTKQSFAITGRVLIDGEPAHDFGVLVTRDFASPDRIPAAIHTRDGRFEISTVEPGQWDVVIVGPGFARYIVPGRRLEEGHSLELGDLSVKHGFTVSGHVTRVDGRPAEGARVSIVTNDRFDVDASLLAQAVGNYLGFAERDGRYEIADVNTFDLAGRTARISASLPDGQLSLKAGVPAGNVIIDMVVTATGQLEGTVSSDDRGGDYFVSVIAVGSVARYTTKVADNNTFVFPKLPVGDYYVSGMIFPGSRHTKMVRVTVVADQPTTITLVP